MNGTHLLLDSPQLGRQVHLWKYGFWGHPVLVFPSAAGFAHEWHAHGMVEALSPLLRAGKIKLYCPESNVAEAFTRKEADPAWRISRHSAYERFVMDTLVPWIRADCRWPDAPLATAGCSLGGLYAASFALKHPKTFPWALCMSGRYEIRPFLNHHDSAEVYHHNPLAFVPGLEGAALEAVRRHTSLTLVCGQGKWEEGCIEETQELGAWLDRKRIPNHTDIWGRDVSHDWPWWKRQATYHFGKRYT